MPMIADGGNLVPSMDAGPISAPQWMGCWLGRAQSFSFASDVCWGRSSCVKLRGLNYLERIRPSWFAPSPLIVSATTRAHLLLTDEKQVFTVFLHTSAGNVALDRRLSAGCSILGRASIVVLPSARTLATHTYIDSSVAQPRAGFYHHHATSDITFTLVHSRDQFCMQAISRHLPSDLVSQHPLHDLISDHGLIRSAK